MPGLFTISLITDKIMNSSFDCLAFFLARADSINLMPDHGQNLERNHDLIILDIIPNQHKNLFYTHFYLPLLIFIFLIGFINLYYYNP